MLKPERNDIKVNIKFEADELELLKENTWQMADSSGLDSRIDKLTGKREVGFYRWDLDCLEAVVGDLIVDKNNPKLVINLYDKIINAIDYIETHSKNKK